MSLRGSLTAQLVLAVVTGVAVGLTVELQAWSGLLASLGAAIIQLIKTFATPLLFFVIAYALMTSEVRGRDALRMVRVALTNATIALLIGLGVSNLIQPGAYLTVGIPTGSGFGLVSGGAPTPPKLNASEVILGLIPKSVLQPFVSNSVLGVVLLAVLVGIALRRHRNTSINELMMSGLKVSEEILSWVVRLVPFAVFAVTAQLVSERGLSMIRGLSIYLGAGLLGFGIHVALTYQFWVKVVAKIPLRIFWKEAMGPVTYAFGANSSLATLPLTLKALRRLGVRDEAAALGACVGTNLNNDGILLYEAMSVLLVAQSIGMDWDLMTQVGAALVCLIAGMGVAGVPEAGFISLTVVVATLGLPAEILPLLLTVDWILARARSSVNVLSDMIVSIAIHHQSKYESRGNV